ncbi:MAG: xanthine dehydrogenase family protein molybdopterin-binding subunit, partial [Planctomycetaceae bacterium]
MAERKHGWGPREQNVLIGKDIPRIDAAPKITGAAKYTADINTQGTLFARVLTCKHAHAKLKKIDLDAARKVPGVKAVHAFKEVDDEIRWDGELIAAVAAERAEQAADGI